MNFVNPEAEVAAMQRPLHPSKRYTPYTGHKTIIPPYSINPVKTAHCFHLQTL